MSLTPRRIDGPPASLSAVNVTVTYHSQLGDVTAVKNASLAVHHGEAVGIVGESGSGKSTLASACIGLLDRSKTRASGTMRLVDQEITALTPKQWENVRGMRVGYVGQDPFGALNPVLRVQRHLDEALRHRPKEDRPRLAKELLAAVELKPEVAAAYPHELSGGMRQRVSIAIAIANSPELLIADEPTTALDVTTQAEILRLLGELRRERGMALLLISHDLGVIRQVCDRVYVMYGGHVVEQGPVEEILGSPVHPYTRGLLRCARLERDPSGEFFDGARQASGQHAVDGGCPYQERCAFATPECAAAPLMSSVGAPGHEVACWHTDQVRAGELQRGDRR